MPSLSKKPKPRLKRGDPVLGGRTKLMDAALHLAATTRSWAAIGLREVARHAGVNPNTFYRHFKDFDDLGLAIVQQLGAKLRADLRARRRTLVESRQDAEREPVSPQRFQQITAETVGLALDFATEYGAAYVVAIRELHGGSPVLRKALRQVMDDLAQDMAEDALRLLPPGLLDADAAHELSHLVIRQMSFLALDYIERPEQRDALREQAERFIQLLFLGAMASRDPKALSAIASRFGIQG